MGHCPGCWYLLRGVAVRSRDPAAWDQLAQYHATGDLGVLDWLGAEADPAALAASRRVVIALGIARERTAD